MKRAAAIAALLVAGVAAGQEIGSEIPVSPPSGQGGQGSATPYVPAPPPKLSASPFSLGLRAQFVGTGLISQPTTSGAPGGLVPTVGIKLLVSNLLAITADVGFAFGLQTFSGSAAFGFTVGAGVDLMLRTNKDALRPLISAAVQFNRAFSGGITGWSLGASVGGGAEYFLAPQFSMSVKLMVGTVFDLDSVSFVVATFSPGVGATVYF